MELDYTASAIDIGIPHSLYNQAPIREHLIKIGIAKAGSKIQNCCVSSSSAYSNEARIFYRVGLALQQLYE
ncbi:MAG: hypothetical protein LBU32_00075 [Clostridiales bacterium]|nr:hypothetical protein [Clostridiales bacterium]